MTIGRCREASAGSPTLQAAQKPGAEKQPAISLTKEELTINGTRVQVGRTTKADLEKQLGPLERSFTPELTVQPMGFWDMKGIRIYYSKDTGVVSYFDCVLVSVHGSRVTGVQKGIGPQPRPG